MKKFKSMEFHRDRPKNFSQSNLSEAKIKAKRLKTSKSRRMFLYKQMENGIR
jgi:hypothetical protein